MNEQVPSRRPRLGTLRRTLVRLQRALGPEPPALLRWLHRPPEWIEMSEVEDLRDAAEQLSSAVADCATLVERVRLLQEELLAIVNERTNHMLFLLTVLTALVAPMTVVSSVFGMNVASIPLQNHPGGFWIVVVLTTIATASAGVFVFRRRGDR